MGKIRTAAAAALTGALLLSGLVAAPAATAATDTKPSITKIKTVTAPYGKKATVKPNIKRPAGVKILSTTLTVKQGKKTIAKNRKAAKLAAGKYKVTTKVKYRFKKVTSAGTVWSKTKTTTRTQTLVVKAGKRPSRTSPNSWGECPSWAPVKGNQSGIYHVPGSTYYSRTNPEECFVSAAAAERAGYRAPLR